MKIVFFGDSITDAGRNATHYMPNFKYGYGYVFLLKAALSKKYPLKYDIVNVGISGNRIVDLLARIKRDVWNEEPDYISILVGVNDVWHEIQNKNGVEIDRYEKYYRDIIEESKKRLPNCKLIMLEPFVLKEEATEAKIDEFLQVKEYAKVVKKLAKEYEIPFVELQKDFDRLAEIYGVKPLLWDGVHPDVFGATVIADNWLKVFEENFEK
ncbi:MAG: SGNH/GDSL hydrolase family protein [Clostridia bacterium]|nr:SGNH/GDSL hydrolase family protein [Clostridia bacterium]